MRSWIKQIVGTVLVLALAAGVGGFVLLLRAQQTGLASSMAAANIQSVSPPDGATNVPTSGEIQAVYRSLPAQDPVIKFEPPVGVVLSNGHWEATTFVLDYSGLRENSLYHVELDQDQPSPKGEHKQIKVRWSFRTGATSATPTETPSLPPPSAFASASPSHPPANVQLIWYGFGSSNLVASDWEGVGRGSIALRVAGQSPDGSKLLPGEPNAPIMDANGNVLGQLPPVRTYLWWADNSSGLCMLGGNMRGDELEWLAANGTVTPIANVAPPSAPPQVPKLAACSAVKHQALVYYLGYGNIYSLKLISLTDGHVIYQENFPNPIQEWGQLIASTDGQYVAEVLPTTPPVIRIRQLPAGSIVGQVSGIYPHGFSWDGSLIVGDIAGMAGTGELRVVNWRTHQTLWKIPDYSTSFVLARPFGTDLALAVWSPDGETAGIYVVHADGKPTLIASGRSPLQPF